MFKTIIMKFAWEDTRNGLFTGKFNILVSTYARIMSHKAICSCITVLSQQKFIFTALISNDSTFSSSGCW